MISWDQYFITMCYLVAMRSKDTSTRIGSVIVGHDNEIKSTGYNSFPMGMNDYVVERYARPEKYFYFEHSERSAIYLASRNGTSLLGARLYTLGTPCADCARGVIQSGIKEVIAHRQWEDGTGMAKWVDSAKRSREMFSECQVLVRYYDGPVAHIDGLRDGKPWPQ